MSTLNQLGPYTEYTDDSLVQIPGPDNSTFGFQFDAQQRAFFTREVSLIFSGKHGGTHVSTDLVPIATCTTPGLLSADDKCRLDNLIGTRIGVLGFQGSGFPDDGGWMQGDIILSAGSEMITLERVGQVIRFVVDVPAVFSCANEDCLQIYWIQDETDIAAIRPPLNGGRLAGVNAYGELKIFLFPENTVVNQANPAAVLNNKGFYPSFIFSRYTSGTGTNQGQVDMVLARNSSGTATIGWAFTPGATGIPEYNIFLGLDTDGNRITVKINPETTPGVLGTILYNGVSITKRLAIITGYDPTVVTSNIYQAKWWDAQGKQTVGDVFSVTNQSSWDTTNNLPVLDSANNSLLSLNQIIEILSIQVGTSNGQQVYAFYCREQAIINPGSLWTPIGAIQFGDTLTSHDGASGTATVDDSRTYEDGQWANDGLHNITVLAGTTPTVINSAYDAIVDTSIPALTVLDNPGVAGEQRRPVSIWHRSSLRDAYLELHFARPVQTGSTSSAVLYPPIDIVFRAPIDSYEVQYGAIASHGTVGSGTYNGSTFVVLTGIKQTQVPKRGLIRSVDVSGYGTTYAYIATMRTADGSAVLIMTSTAPADNADIEVLHEEYQTPALRLQFGFNNGHDITLQTKVGILDPTAIYEASDSNVNDFAGQFLPGYAVGLANWQDGATASGTTGISSHPDGFVVYNGSRVSGDDVFNVAQVLIQDQKLWIWWNGLLMAPSSADSALLPTPVDISTPYYPITDIVEYGKFGVRLFPGAKLRRFIVRSKPVLFSEFSLGQIEVGS